MSKKLAVAVNESLAEYGAEFAIEDQDRALALARLLTYAADEAGELGAPDCQLLVTLALRDLKEQFSLVYNDVIEMSPDAN